MHTSRREFIKGMAAAWSAAVAGSLVGCSGDAEVDAASVLEDAGVVWTKGPLPLLRNRLRGDGRRARRQGRRGRRRRAEPGQPGSAMRQGLSPSRHPLWRGPADQAGHTGERRGARDLDGRGARLRRGALQAARRGARKESIAVYGSGQWTVQDGYAATKWMRAGVGNNNVEANARLCMASAVTGFLTTFGKDEPMGCYDDFELGDVFVFWGNNMAEMHPVLFSRITARKQAVPGVQLVDIGTRRTRTTEASDLYLEFRPHSDWPSPTPSRTRSSPTTGR